MEDAFTGPRHSWSQRVRGGQRTQTRCPDGEPPTSHGSAIVVATANPGCHFDEAHPAHLSAKRSGLRCLASVIGVPIMLWPKGNVRLGFG